MVKYLLGCSAVLFLLSCGEKASDKAPKASHTAAAKPVTQARDAAPEDATTGPDGVVIVADGLPTAVTGFIPAGYSILDTSAGDLNSDAYPDLVVVLKKDGEETAETDVDNPVKRPLLLFTGGADGSYALAARSDNTVYCAKCGGMMGDPYTGITINKGYFSIEHYGGSSWRWSRIVTYKYAPADKTWLLHKDGGESFNANDPEKVDSKVRTTKDFGKVRFEQFDIYAEEEDDRD